MRRVVAGTCGVILGGLPGGLAAIVLTELGPRLRRPCGAAPDPMELAARLLVLIGAGLPLTTALEVAAGSEPHLEPLARRARRLGSAAALASAQGEFAPLLRRLAHASASGSPPEPALRAYIEMERRRRQTEAVERARRLPVRLMVPMTLLVLPGFVVLVYGPAFIDLVTSLLGSLVTQ